MRKRVIGIFLLTVLLVVLFSFFVIAEDELTYSENRLIYNFATNVNSGNHEWIKEYSSDTVFNNQIFAFLREHSFSELRISLRKINELNDKQKKVYLEAEGTYKKRGGAFETKVVFPFFIVMEEKDNKVMVVNTNFIIVLTKLWILPVSLLIYAIIVLSFIIHILRNVQVQKYKYVWVFFIVFGSVIGMMIYIYYIRTQCRGDING